MFGKSPSLHYYSQLGEDEYLDQQVFGGKRDGVFVDIGAHDGVTFSNTYFLEKMRSWQGVCIEPLPEMFAKLKQNRSATCINAGISDKEGTQEFLKVEGAGNAEMFSGLMSKYDKRHLERVKREVVERKGSSKVIKIKTLLLNNILADANLTHVDYCTIDTEGGELDILKTIDFDRCQFDVFTVEDLFGNDTMANFMKQNGYRLLKRLDVDCVYARNDFVPQELEKGLFSKFQKLIRYNYETK